MARVVPSEIVRVIDTWYPVANPANTGKLDFWIGRKRTPQVNTILALVDQLPDELLMLQSEDYIDYVAAVEALRHAITRWEAGLVYQLGVMPGFDLVNPVVMVRRALALCPDEAPSPLVSGLEFVDDEDFRRQLRIDMSAMERATIHGEWKAATILGGSVVEALLLWKMQLSDRRTITKAVTELLDKGSGFLPKLTRRPPKKLEDWNLYQLVLLSWKSGLISDDTAKQCDLLRNFRNLIHPGRTQRLEQVCDKGTAYAAAAAVEAVCRDLS